MTSAEFSAEKKYLLAMHMAEELRLKGLITQEEYTIIDTKLQAEIGPKFGVLCSELSCYCPDTERT